MKLAIGHGQKEVALSTGGWWRTVKRMGFYVEARLEFTELELAALAQQELLDVPLCHADAGNGTEMPVLVSELLGGVTITFLDPGAAATYEEDVKIACQNLKALIERVVHGDSEEVIEF